MCQFGGVRSRVSAGIRLPRRTGAGGRPARCRRTNGGTTTGGSLAVPRRGNPIARRRRQRRDARKLIGLERHALLAAPLGRYCVDAANSLREPNRWSEPPARLDHLEQHRATTQERLRWLPADAATSVRRRCVPSPRTLSLQQDSSRMGNIKPSCGCPSKRSANSWAPRVNQSDGFSPRSETGVSSYRSPERDCARPGRASYVHQLTVSAGQRNVTGTTSSAAGHGLVTKLPLTPRCRVP